ncbi:MAG: dicarboxylate/amino acid:cation symporter [Clostridium sp.]|nr:dicarboxylate/amino acid:cation symporter [Clostridium sp.]
MSTADETTGETPPKKKKRHIGLLPKIIIAIVAGIAIGWIAPAWVGAAGATFNEIFGSLLGYLVPLIIVGFVTPAIAELGNKAGKLLVFTALLAYVATLCAGLTSYFIGDHVFPSLIPGDMGLVAVEDSPTDPQPWFRMPIPALMPVMTALVTAFMLGLGIAYCRATTINAAAVEFRAIMVKTINRVVIPLLPIYILCIFMNMTIAGKVGAILAAFAKIIVVIFLIHILVLVIQFVIASLFNHRNPLKMLWNMMPAYFTALGTQSSAATIPVTLRQTVKMGVSEEIAGFTVPLCATIHMSGSTLKIVACAMALMIMQHIPYDFGLFIHFIALLGITIVAAPGIPGGAIMASLGLLSSVLGFSDAQNAMMIALYIAMDSFGTACNVTGDGALAVIVDFFFGDKRKKKQTI